MKRIVLALIATIAVLLPAGSPVWAASCNGASHDPTLFNGGANPGSAGPGALITFSVSYTDTAGCVPSSVTVTVADAGTFALSPIGSNFNASVAFVGALALSPGSHAYTFSATSGSGGGTKTVTLSAVTPGTVFISDPAPPPPPPAPVPPPVIPAPAPVPPPVPPDPPAPEPTATATATPSPTPSPTARAAPSPTGMSPTLGNPRGRLEPDRSLGAASTAGSRTQAASGFFTLELPLGPLVAYLSATAAGLAFFMFLVRRRSDIQPEAAGMTLATATATATAPASSASGSAERRVTPLPPMRELIPPVNPNLLTEGEEPIGPAPGEAALPRWLRPSVRNGRRTRNPDRLRGWED